MALDYTRNLLIVCEGQSNTRGSVNLTDVGPVGDTGNFSEIPATGIYNQYKVANYPANVHTRAFNGTLESAPATADSGNGTIGYFQGSTTNTLDTWTWWHSMLIDLSNDFTTNAPTKEIAIDVHGYGGTSLSSSATPNNWHHDNFSLNWESWKRFRITHQAVLDNFGEYDLVKIWCQGESDNNAWSSERTGGTANADTTYVTDMIARQKWWKDRLGIYPRTILVPLGNASPSRRDFNDEVWDYLVSATDANGDSYNFELPFTRTPATDMHDDWPNAIDAEEDATNFIDPTTPWQTIWPDQTHYGTHAKILVGRIIADHLIN